MSCGVDIVCISEFEKLLSASFVVEHFTNAEKTYCESAHGAPAAHFAVRYAAKEALIKAVEGLHLFRPRLIAKVFYAEIEVQRDPSGRPYFIFSGEMEKIISDLKKNVSVSLSHDGDYAVAQVVMI